MLYTLYTLLHILRTHRTRSPYMSSHFRDPPAHGGISCMSYREHTAHKTPTYSYNHSQHEPVLYLALCRLALRFRNALKSLSGAFCNSTALYLTALMSASTVIEHCHGAGKTFHQSPLNKSYRHAQCFQQRPHPPGEGSIMYGAAGKQ